MRRLVMLFAVLALAGCGDDARQDADEPEGTFKLEVVDASFPERQQIAEPVEFKVSVRNADDETLRNVAVTVQTEPKGSNSAIAFGQRSTGTGLADSGRPIWVLDEGPLGGDVHDRLPRLPRPDWPRPGRAELRHQRVLRGHDRRRAGPGPRRRGRQSGPWRGAGNLVAPPRRSPAGASMSSPY